MSFSKEFKERRIDVGFATRLGLAEYCSEKCGESDVGKFVRFINSIEDDGEIPGNISMYESFVIAEALNIDDGAFLDCEIKDKPTPEEVLEYWDPCGKGTIEQRVYKLVAHCQISMGRGCEILGRKKIDGLPEIESTGCNCLECRELLKYRGVL